MTSLGSSEHTLARFDPRRALWRSTIALAVGGTAGVLSAIHYPLAVAALFGWNIGGATLLVLAWLNITRCDPTMTHARAGEEDPGRTAVYVLVVLTSCVSLFAATILSRLGRRVAGSDEALLVGLCLAAVVLSWLLTQTSFTMRYAHLYYREDAEGIGGVQFPGTDAPSYSDFAYFAFTVGMCFQVSDCAVTSPQIRRAVLVHAALSFAYNTLILAFTLNLVFGVAAQ